jgi:hypothetical protein
MKWDINLRPDGVVEIWSYLEEMGPKIECRPNGEIELFDVMNHGSRESSCGLFETLPLAMEEGKKLI